MGKQPDSRDNKKAVGFKTYASKRIIVTIALIAVVVWAFSSIPETPSNRDRDAVVNHQAGILQASSLKGHVAPEEKEATRSPEPNNESPTLPGPEEPPSEIHADQPDDPDATDHGETDNPPDEGDPQASSEAVEHDTAAESAPRDPSETGPVPTPHSETPEATHTDLPAGAVFINAVIAPLDYELNERFYGWRPNDIINITDNIGNFQLGVLEVTRRTVVLLAERISRTGTTDAFNPHLESSMNWLMVKANQYWFPSPESKFKESMEELKAFRDAVLDGRGSFYTRADNLIPLLSTYEDLLGSCDENLVKQKNKDGSKVSLFRTDDHFYYAKGVANSMAIILEAVHHDFQKTLESKHAAELLHNAIESCRQAAALDPLIVTDGDLDGILANHRANMAAPISHARFYIGQLVKTLST